MSCHCFVVPGLRVNGVSRNRIMILISSTVFCQEGEMRDGNLDDNRRQVENNLNKIQLGKKNG